MNPFRKRQAEPEPQPPWWDVSVPWTPPRPPSGPATIGPTGIIDEREQDLSRRQAELDEQVRQHRRDAERAEAEAECRDRLPVADGSDPGFANLM